MIRNDTIEGKSLTIQWLRPCASLSGVRVPFLFAVWCGQKKKTQHTREERWNFRIIFCQLLGHSVVSLSPSWVFVILISFSKLPVGLSFPPKVYQNYYLWSFWEWRGQGAFFFWVISVLLSSFVSFFGWRMGYCCLTCHLYVLFTHGFYKRSHYHIWFISYCKCPFKSICFNKLKKKITKLALLYNQGKYWYY